MDNATIQKLKDMIAKSQSIGVVVGKDPTLDQMAAALSLYFMLLDLRKKVSIAAPQDPIVEISSLVGIDKVQRTLGGSSGDLTVSFPYVEEGEIEKVSYTIENGYLNIIVKAGEKGLSFDQRDVKYTRDSGAVDLLFVIGTTSLSEIDDVIDTEKIRNTKIINIDNDDANQDFGDLVLVSPDDSSISEQIGDLALTLDFNFDRDTAQNLLDGLMSATNNFQDPKTSSLAFEIASEVMKEGAIRRTAPERTGFRPQINEQVSTPLRQTSVRTSLPSESIKRSEDRFPGEDRPQESGGLKSREEKVREELKQKDQQDADKAPSDWLAPKVYKGTDNFG